MMAPAPEISEPRIGRRFARDVVLITPSSARPSSYLLETECLIRRPIEQVFEFFSNARNLERITPTWLRFEVLTPDPIRMAAGTLIDYRLRVRGLPLRWQSEITTWEPPFRFVDVQRRGPYYHWNHEHVFESVEDGTWVRDEVTYKTPGGSIVNRLLVAPDLRRVFEYRRKALIETFGK